MKKIIVLLIVTFSLLVPKLTLLHAREIQETVKFTSPAQDNTDPNVEYNSWVLRIVC